MKNTIYRICYSLIALLPFMISTIVSSAELDNFSWYEPAVGAGDTNSEFIFEYDIVTASPLIILDALSDGIDTTSLGQPFDASVASVTINGEPADIDFDISYNYGNGVFIQLVDHSLVKSGDRVEVILQGVKNNNIPGNYPWAWIRTTDDSGNAVDEVANPRVVDLWGYELNNASWSNTSSEAGATNVSYEFSYDLTSSSPDTLLYVHIGSFVVNGEREYPIDFLRVGQVLDDSKVKVTINGVAADIEFGRSWIGGGTIVVRLVDPSMAKAGNSIVVTVNGVTHNTYADIYNWVLIRTAHPSGQAMDQMITPIPLVLNDKLVSVIVDLTFDGIPVSSDGGRLYFNRSITCMFRSHPITHSGIKRSPVSV